MEQEEGTERWVVDGKAADGAFPPEHETVHLRLCLDEGELEDLHDKRGMSRASLSLEDATAAAIKQALFASSGSGPEGKVLRARIPGLWRRVPQSGDEPAPPPLRRATLEPGVFPTDRLAWEPLPSGDILYDLMQRGQDECHRLRERCAGLIRKLQLTHRTRPVALSCLVLSVTLDPELGALAALGARRLAARFLVSLVVELQWLRAEHQLQFPPRGEQASPLVPDLRLEWNGGPEPLELLLREASDAPVTATPSSRGPFVREQLHVHILGWQSPRGAQVYSRESPEIDLSPLIPSVDATMTLGAIRELLEATVRGKEADHEKAPLLVLVTRHPPDLLQRLGPYYSSGGVSPTSRPLPKPGAPPWPPHYDLRQAVERAADQLARAWAAHGPERDGEREEASPPFVSARTSGERLSKLARLGLSMKDSAMAARILALAEQMSRADLPDKHADSWLRTTRTRLGAQAWELAWLSIGGALADDANRRWWWAQCHPEDASPTAFVNPFLASQGAPVVDPPLNIELRHVVLGTRQWQGSARGTKNDRTDGGRPRSVASHWFDHLSKVWEQPGEGLKAELSPLTLPDAILALQAGMAAIVHPPVDQPQGDVLAQAATAFEAALRGFRRFDHVVGLALSGLWLSAIEGLQLIAADELAQQKPRTKEEDEKQRKRERRASERLTWTSGLLQRAGSQNLGWSVEYHWTAFLSGHKPDRRRMSLWRLVHIAPHPRLEQSDRTRFDLRSPEGLFAGRATAAATEPTSEPLWTEVPPQLLAAVDAARTLEWDIDVKGDRVFLNVPYDEDYAPFLELAEVIILGAGFQPLLASDHDKEDDKERMEGIQRAILASRASVHDLVRARGEGLHGFARMNMALEMGLGMGLRHPDTKSHLLVALVPDGVPLELFASDVKASFERIETYRSLMEYGEKLLRVLAELRTDGVVLRLGLHFWLRAAGLYAQLLTEKVHADSRNELTRWAVEPPERWELVRQAIIQAGGTSE